MRTIFNFILTAFIVLGLSYLLPGVEVSGFWGALCVALVLALLNALIKPLLVFFTLPITLITLGLFLWVINALIILMASKILKESFQVDGFGWALLFSLLLSFCQSIFQSKKEEEN